MCIVYIADVIKQNKAHILWRIDGEFKYYNNHTNLFQNQDSENKTELSKHIWQLKCNGNEFNLKWSITAQGFRIFQELQRKCIAESLVTQYIKANIVDIRLFCCNMKEQNYLVLLFHRTKST